jgi:hypothetical protein
MTHRQRARFSSFDWALVSGRDVDDGGVVEIVKRGNECEPWGRELNPVTRIQSAAGLSVIFSFLFLSRSNQ